MKTRKHIVKFKVGPEIYKQIKEIVKVLEPLQKTDASGKPLFRKITQFVGTKGYSGPNEKYTKTTKHGQEPLLVNHEVNLISEFEKFGPKGVKDYVDYVKELVRKTKEEQEKKEPVTSEQND